MPVIASCPSFHSTTTPRRSTMKMPSRQWRAKARNRSSSGVAVAVAASDAGLDAAFETGFDAGFEARFDVGSEARFAAGSEARFDAKSEDRSDIARGSSSPKYRLCHERAMPGAAAAQAHEASVLTDGKTGSPRNLLPRRT